MEWKFGNLKFTQTEFFSGQLIPDSFVIFDLQDQEEEAFFLALKLQSNLIKLAKLFSTEIATLCALLWNSHFSNNSSEWKSKRPSLSFHVLWSSILTMWARKGLDYWTIDITFLSSLLS